MTEEEQQDVNLDARALGLLSKYRAQLYVDALDLCHDSYMAESLVLHTIDAALRSYDEDTANVYPLLRTILKNAYINETRRAVDRATSPIDAQALAEDDALAVNTTEDEILRNSDNEALRAAIDRLGPEYKKTVVMHYLMDMPLKEIARVLHRPIGTIKWRLSVAKGLLAGMLKKALGNIGTWILVLAGFAVGCVTAVVVMRMPSRPAGKWPSGGQAFNTPQTHEITVMRAPQEVKVDGELGEWGEPVFEAACNPPYERDYTASVRIMWDDEKLYIGGDIRTPDPMRNRSEAHDGLGYAGGSVICRIADDASLGWPLSASLARDSRASKQDPMPDNGLVSLILFYDDVAGRARLKAHRRLHSMPIEIPPDAWCGAFCRHRDGHGYTFEYAISWMAVGVTPPKAGEVRANTWNIHFSDAYGVACTGQIVENVVAKIPRHPLYQQVCNYCFFPPAWGKAVFSETP